MPSAAFLHDAAAQKRAIAERRTIGSPEARDWAPSLESEATAAGPSVRAHGSPLRTRNGEERRATRERWAANIACRARDKCSA